MDEIKFNPGDKCKGHCTFDSGLCKFSNDQSGNFLWQVVSNLQEYLVCYKLVILVRAEGATTLTPDHREIILALPPTELLELLPSLRLPIREDQETSKSNSNSIL